MPIVGDPIAFAQAVADLALINSKLTLGMTQMKENNREMRFDLSSLRTTKDELETYIAACLMSAPKVRRVLMYSPSKGL